MVELQLINKILEEKSLNVLKRNNLDENHFNIEQDKIEYIIDHFKRWGRVPDFATFMEKFPDFERLGVSESEEYLAYKLKEAKLYEQLVPVIKQAGEKLREDSFEALLFLKDNLNSMARSLEIGEGSDIVKGADTRLAEYEKRREVEGILGISTGIRQLDRLTHGWMKEDLITIFARTNEGKSWILLYFLMMAWRQGKRVLMYSGEMSKDITGFRFDTLNANFSNMGLMLGADNLGRGGEEVTAEDYAQYIQELKERESFIVITPKDLGGRRPTVDDIRRFAERYEADIIGIDQITLMDDRRRGENKRIRYTNIAEDLFALSEDLEIPVMAVTQANREAVRSGRSPELHQVGESDGIAQNSTRVFSMKVVDNVLRLSIKKNRYGLNNQDVAMLWDINHGIIKPLVSNETVHEEDYGF